MKAYVELIQRKERELGTDILTHQKVCITTVIEKNGFNDMRAVERRGLRR
jgi:isocitrate lyase